MSMDSILGKWELVGLILSKIGSTSFSAFLFQKGHLFRYSKRIVARGCYGSSETGHSGNKEESFGNGCINSWDRDGYLSWEGTGEDPLSHRYEVADLKYWKGGGWGNSRSKLSLIEKFSNIVLTFMFFRLGYQEWALSVLGDESSWHGIPTQQSLRAYRGRCR